MRSFLTVYITAFLLSICSVSYCQTEPTSTPAVAVVQVEAPVQTVQVAEPAAPPKWAEQLIMTAQDLPVVGPVVSKALIYLGIISAILTSLIAFLLTTISALTKVFNLVGLVNFATKLQAFSNGPIMYWLKYLSLFNAKKPEKPLVAASESTSKAAA